MRHPAWHTHGLRRACGGRSSLGMFRSSMEPSFLILEVEPRRYRFRVVNASNSRFFSLFFSDPALPFSTVAMKFFQIGSDGGLLPQPVEVTSTMLAPAERADLIVDFSGHAGKKFIVSNYASAPFPGTGNDESPMKAAPLQQLMEVRVSARLRGS